MRQFVYNKKSIYPVCVCVCVFVCAYQVCHCVYGVCVCVSECSIGYWLQVVGCPQETLDGWVLSAHNRPFLPLTCLSEHDRHSWPAAAHFPSRRCMLSASEQTGMLPYRNYTTHVSLLINSHFVSRLKEINLSPNLFSQRFEL